MKDFVDAMFLYYVRWKQMYELSVFVDDVFEGIEIKQKIRISKLGVGNKLEAVEQQLRSIVTKTIIYKKEESSQNEPLDKKLNDLEINNDKSSRNTINNYKFDCCFEGVKYTSLHDLTYEGGPDACYKFKLLNKSYTIIIDHPHILNITLPKQFYIGMEIDPHISWVHSNEKCSSYIWYISKDKKNWEKICETKQLLVKTSFIDYFIKFRCEPKNQKYEGPPYEIETESTVYNMEEPSVCPFEKRHLLTKEYLKEQQFRFVTYNTLADRYARSDKIPYCPYKYLGINFRKHLILRELKGYHADIICLQEVDSNVYDNFLKPELLKCGYKSCFHRKGNVIPEGLVCAFLADRYSLIESMQIVFKDVIMTKKMFDYPKSLLRQNPEMRELFLQQKTSLQTTILKDQTTNKIIIVCNTHLFYHPEAPHIRLMQINMAVTHLEHMKRLTEKETGCDISAILCGDFNSHSKTSLHVYLNDGDISCYDETCLKISPSGQCNFQNNIQFKNACGFPKYTNYTEDFKGCLDYIYIQADKFDVEQVIPLPPNEELEKYIGIPNQVYPSDHLALVVDLKYIE